jgi:hypothetical protein
MSIIPTSEKIKRIYLQFQTPHYSFQMTLTETDGNFHTFNFIVGNPLKPCLEGIVTLENKLKNNRFKNYENNAKLIKLDALEECSLEDITTDYMDKHSFGKEMLDSIVFFINSQFPSIKTISLDDKSYIPCNRESGDTLDLLSYSIALYKKTWYEERLDAYMLPKENYETYRKQVDAYASKETKEKYLFEDFYYLLQSHNRFATEVIENNVETYRGIYEKSETFPDFFKEISKGIQKKDKCRFFKDWLYSFISSKIRIDRTWYFDLFPKIISIQKSNMKSLRNKTRRNKNIKK